MRFSLGELIPDPYIGGVKVTRMSRNMAPVNAEKKAEAEKRYDVHREAQADPHREALIARILASHPGLTRDKVLAEMEAYGF